MVCLDRYHPLSFPTAVFLCGRECDGLFGQKHLALSFLTVVCVEGSVMICLDTDTFRCVFKPLSFCVEGNVMVCLDRDTLPCFFSNCCRFGREYGDMYVQRHLALSVQTAVFLCGRECGDLFGHRHRPLPFPAAAGSSIVPRHLHQLLDGHVFCCAFFLSPTLQFCLSSDYLHVCGSFVRFLKIIYTHVLNFCLNFCVWIIYTHVLPVGWALNTNDYN